MASHWLTRLRTHLAGLRRGNEIESWDDKELLPGDEWDEMIKKNIEEAQQAILDQIPAGRFGSPEEFGAACAFLCSAASGFIAGQNLLLDGGAYPGTFG